MIVPFTSHLPIRISFGDGVVAALPAILRGEGCRRAFVAVDAGLEELVPPVAAVLAALEREEIQLTRFVKDPGEPTIDVVDAAASALVAATADAVVAIGGGSVMDTAKSARLCALRGTTFAEFLAGDRSIPPPSLPLVCIPTTAGTGSEVSGGAVITDPGTLEKIGIAGPNLRAQYALVDPVLTYSLPPKVTAYAGSRRAGTGDRGDRGEGENADRQCDRARGHSAGCEVARRRRPRRLRPRRAIRDGVREPDGGTRDEHLRLRRGALARAGTRREVPPAARPHRRARARRNARSRAAPRPASARARRRGA